MLGTLLLDGGLALGGLGMPGTGLGGKGNQSQHAAAAGGLSVLYLHACVLRHTFSM